MEKQLEILIVEDDPASALRLTRELDSHRIPYGSRRVSERHELADALRERSFDLILSEQTLTSLSGFAALDLARELAPGVPFIFVSAHCDQGRLVEMLESGASGHVFKHRLGDLVPLIRQVLAATSGKASSAERILETSVRTPASSAPEHPVDPSTLPICGGCRQIRNETGVWEQLESFLRRNPRATVALALCPTCAAARYTNG